MNIIIAQTATHYTHYTSQSTGTIRVRRWSTWPWTCSRRRAVRSGL